jgi:iron complex outermembrane recepter protein
MTKARMQKVLRGLPAHIAAGVMVGVASMASSAAYAQATPDSEETSSDDGGIPEIIVNARLRQENLQETPLAISAVTSEMVENSVVTDIAGIQKFVPNIQLGRVAFAGNSLSAGIRGISFGDLEKTFDPAVGLSIDGVFLGTSTGANVDLNDVEAIEVLRGPQGTLFGRNTVGGIIKFRRTRPTGELGARLHTRYGSFNALDLDAVVNFPKIGDAISVKVSGLRRTSDSFTRNRVTNKREDGRDYYTLGLSVLAEIGSDTSILASVDYQKDRSTYPSNINLTKANGLPFGAGGTICDFTLQIGLGDLGCDTQGYLRQRAERFRFANTTIPFESFIDGWSASLELQSKIGDFNLTAITGYRDTSDSLLQEGTGTPLIPVAPGVALPLFVTARDQDYEQISQEIRIQGDLSDSIDLVAGIYYLHTDYKIRPLAYNGAAIATAYFLGGPAQRIDSTQKLDSFAVFAESIIKLGSNLRLTVGGRYTTETKKFTTALSLPAPAAFAASAKATFKDPSGRIILDWKPNDHTMLYASWSRGIRSGGFNGRGASPTSIGPYQPEKVDSFELGLKADFADGMFRFNPTIFQANYGNKQEDILRPAPSGFGTETVVENVASARIRGIELELLARPTPELTLRAAGSHLDAEYRRFLIPNLALPGAPLVDVSALRNFRAAPKYSFNAGLDYLREIGGGNSLGLTIDYVYTDDVFAAAVTDTSGAKRDIIPASARVNASIAFMHSGDNLKNLRISGYVRDLFHKEGGSLAASIDAGLFYFGVVVPTREFGLEASIKF